MKKLLYVFLPLLLLSIAAVVVWQTLPEKRYARHVIKARLYAKEGNLTAARFEYEKAFEATDGYTPYASLEVLNLTNHLNIQDKKPLEALENTKKFVATYKTNKEGMTILANLAFQLGENELAFETLHGLLEQEPSHFQGRLLLANVRAKQGRLDLAEEQLRLLNTRFPDSIQSLLPLAEVLLKGRRSVEGREFLLRALAKDPKNPRARFMLVDSYILQRDLDSALLMLDQWQESDPDRKQQVQLRKARLYSLTGKRAEAVAALVPYMDRKESNILAFSELAILHAKAGEYDSALALYQTIADISPKSRILSESMSYFLHMKALNPARALEALKTVQVVSKDASLLPRLIAAYLAIGQSNKAEDVINQQPDSLQKPLKAFMGDMLPDKEFIGQWALISYFGANQLDPMVFESVGQFYKQWPTHRLPIEMWTSQLSSVGQFAEAAKVLATVPKPTLTQKVALMQLLANSGQGEKVRASAEQLIQEYPKLKGVNSILADYWIKKDKTKSMAYYESELALNPDNAVVLNNLAWEYGIVQKDLAKAQPYLEKLRKGKNLDPRIFDTVGWILASNGKATEGERYIRNALNLVPDYPPFLYHMSFILKETGKKDEARKMLQDALKSKLMFDERESAEKLLGELG
jgi:cellulose synthase operon protein C